MMKYLKLSLLFAFITLFIGCAMTSFIDNWQTMETDYLNFLVEAGVSDTTEGHLQNMSETVQIAEGTQFIKGGNNLYRITDGKRKKVIGDVGDFVVLGSEIFYDNTKMGGLCKYNMLDETNKTILPESSGIFWFTVYNDEFLCLTYEDKAVLYNKKGELQSVISEDVGLLPEEIVLLGDYLFMFSNGEVKMVDLIRRKTEKIRANEGLAYNFAYAGKENIYYSSQAYGIRGDYSEEKVKSKWNGLWKISLADIENEHYRSIRVSDTFYEKFYCIEDELYDVDFNRIAE